MSEINILYPFDDNYAPFAGISMTSLLENNRQADSIRIYVLGFDLSGDNIDRLRATVEKYDRKIVFIDPKPVEEYIRTLDMPSYRGAVVAVARLLVTMFIPETVARLLYLDSDTIITGSLGELIETDLEGKPVGMVCDSVAGDYKKIMGFGPDEAYFNAGMIVYDMPEWRKQGCTERIIEHINHVRKSYEALDQDLINIVLKGDIARLDLRYNFQPAHYIYSPKTYLGVYGGDGYYTGDEITKARDDIRILHAFRYLGQFPWHERSIHPYRSMFEDYKQISQWSGMSLLPASLSLTHRIERILYRVLPKKVFLRLFRSVFLLGMKKIEKRIKKNKGYANI